jgi:hypothetical protein
MRLTLRTLLAYLDDTLPPDQAKAIGQKVAESETAQDLIDRIRKVTRRRGLSTPTADMGPAADPNTVADYLSDALPAEQTAQFEKTSLESDVLLAEAAACHQILTLLLSEPVRVPPTARQRMYQLVKGPESQLNRKPGATVPVAGEFPETGHADADDADAPYLLGMRAFSRSEPLGRSAAPLAAILGVAAALCVAVWFALPSPRRTAESADGTPAVGFIPGVPPAPAAKPPDPKPDPEPGAKKPAADKQGPAAAAPPVKGDAKQPDTAKPATPPAGDLVPAPDKPRMDRVVVGRVESEDAIVMTRDGAGGKWLRATAKEPDVFATDRVVVLPGYRAKLRVDPATEVELWGNLPELQQLIPVLETAITLYPTGGGFDADLAVHAGRVYLAAKRPTGVKVRLRVRDEVWDVTLPDDKAEVAFEVVNTLVPGVSRDIDPGELPLTSVGFAVLKGAAGLKVRYKDIPQIKANEGVTWTSKGPGLQGPHKLDNAPPVRASAYYSRFELPVGEDAKAAREALADLSKRAGRDSILVAFAESLRDDDAPATLSRAAVAKLAVYAHAALGDLSPVIDALNDGQRWPLRQAAAVALWSTLAGAPDGVEKLRQRLVDKLGLREEQAAFAVRLLRGCSPAERRDPEVLDRLVEGLASNDLIVRELAFAALSRDVIDPDVPTTVPQRMYNASAPAEVRDDGVKAWKRYVEQLKKRPAAPKPAEKK